MKLKYIYNKYCRCENLSDEDLELFTQEISKILPVIEELSEMGAAWPVLSHSLSIAAPELQKILNTFNNFQTQRKLDKRSRR